MLGGRLALLGLGGFAVLASGAAAGLWAQAWDVPVGRPYMSPGTAAWLGTDALGYDLFAQVVQGARVSLVAGVGGAAGAVAVGGLLGAWAGLRGGWTDRLLSGATDAFAAVPPVVALLAMALALGPGVATVVVAIAVTQWTGVFRAARAEGQRLRVADYYRAAEAMGAGALHQIGWHVVPALRPVLLSALVVLFAHAVKVEALLAYLGASAPELPSWGKLLARSGSELARGVWWPTVAASAPLALLVLCAQVLADSSARRPE
ncbi:ABC transporter permease [Nannocystis bainbridge]|uniref:ABC transporter permease subunit n=1 Tax=Nannocystis bainbridge TaxID=2995303 RepID=A0ABT5DWD6_9BACT|nr:ABC transporter permease subunit [Nannocystis bainbridge]MDC0717033.1 ABC transporter permease subunit [Nannocystis bainbridge]